MEDGEALKKIPYFFENLLLILDGLHLTKMFSNSNRLLFVVPISPAISVGDLIIKCQQYRNASGVRRVRQNITNF